MHPLKKDGTPKKLNSSQITIAKYDKFPFPEDIENKTKVKHKNIRYIDNKSAIGMELLEANDEQIKRLYGEIHHGDNKQDRH